MTRARTSRPFAVPRAAVLCAVLLLGRSAAADETGADATRGAEVFQKYCVLCHGSSGHGDGRAAGLQKAPPADLTLSRRSDAYKLQIIRGGGTALQRSASMPAWTDVLSDTEILDVVAYLRTLSPPAPQVPAAVQPATHPQQAH